MPTAAEAPLRSQLDKWENWEIQTRTSKPFKDSHHAMEINFVENGSVTYLFGGKILTVTRGEFILFWGITPHQVIRCERRTLHHWMEIPLTTFLQWQLPSKFVSRLIAGDVISENNSKLHEHDSFVMHRWHRDLKDRQPHFQKIVALEVESRILRLALASTGKVRPFQRQGQNAHNSTFQKIGKLATFISEHYTEPLRLDQIARQVSLRADYATTLFKKITGLSIMEYVVQHRIAHAERLLLTTDDKVLDIALQSGFGSSSRFYEAFTNAGKRSPKKYRCTELEKLKSPKS